METYTFPHFHPHISTVHLSLFHSVRNASHLLNQIISAASLPTGHPDQLNVDFAFIDADMVVSREQVLNAVLQSMICKERGGAAATVAAAGPPGVGGMKTKTIHSEVIWNLFPGRNISSSLREIGLSPKTTSLLLIHICPAPPTISADSILSRMTNLVQGDLDLNGLASLETRSSSDSRNGDKDDQAALESMQRMSTTNWKELNRLYKLDSTLGEDRRRTVIESSTAIKNVAG